MAFPTIPTVAAGRVLFANQADTTATRTFPAFSGLTYSDGDLLLAIVTTYQSSTNPQFSSWSNGFTELSAGGDQGTSSTMGVGIAYKIASGTESGSLTVTQAATITGHASMCLLAIPGAHASTAPEAGTIANATSSAADPGSFNPAGWGTEDTLWIAVAASGMTSGTGSWTATGTAAPANYTDRGDSNTTDSSAVGQTEIAVAFRQLNAASEDVGTAGVDTSNARNSALVIAVRPAAAVAVALAGNEATGDIGTLAPSAAYSVATTGNEATGAIGAVIASVVIALSGVAGTGAAGDLGASSGFNVALSGNAATASEGSLAASASVAIAGNEANGGVGNLSPAAAFAIELTGNEATGAAGSVSAAVVATMAGNEATGAAGALSASLTTSLSGNEATAGAGTLAADIKAPMTGNAGAGAAGSVFAAGDVTLPASGVAATGAAGSVTPSLSVGLTGNEAASAVGGVGAAVGAGLDGNASTGAVGSLVVFGTVVSIPLIGNEAAGGLGSLFPFAPTPERIYKIRAEDRIYLIRPEDSSRILAGENRVYRV